MKLMEHQLDVVPKLASGKILYGGVGVGKSVTVLQYYMEKEAPKDVYVITTAKKRDTLEWMKDASHFGIGAKESVPGAGVIGVDSWNNIGNYVGIEDAFFIFDEQRLVGSGAWTKAFQKIAKKNHWIMLTATPGDTWMDYIPVFVANGLYRNPTEFKREHVVYAPFSRYPKIVRYLDLKTLEKYRNMLLVEMPYKKHTQRHVTYVQTQYNVTDFDVVLKKRWNPYEERPVKDVSELFRLMRKVVNSDESRLREIHKIFKSHAKLIIFYNFNYELELLRTLRDDGIRVAEWNGHKKEPIPDSKRWAYLVQYVAGAEGWNCTATDAMVFYSLTYSWKNLEQAMGRIDRLDTPFTDLWYYVLVSDSFIDVAVRGSLNNKKLFNERKWGREHGLDRSAQGDSSHG